MPGPLGQAVDTILHNELKTNEESKFSFDQNTRDGQSGKFTVKTHAYPSNLGQQELNQFVLFNINIRGKSKRLRGENRIAVINRDVSGANLNSKELSTAGAAAVGATLATGGLAAANFLSTKQKQELTGLQKATNLLKTGALIAAGAAAINAAKTNETARNLIGDILPDTTYRISDAIALYINDPPQVKYSAEYSNKDLGTLAGFVGGISGEGSLGSFVKEGGQALVATLAKAPQALGLGQTSDVLRAAAQTTLNPFKEVLFEAIDFRSFQFKYRFMPKSDWEANAVQEIIQTFKYHMHPELSENKLFFIYPSEFEITYFYNGKRNPYFHKFKPCVLESLDVTYGGDQYASFFNGKPTEINLSMVFREKEILTKKNFVKTGESY